MAKEPVDRDTTVRLEKVRLAELKLAHFPQSTIRVLVVVDGSVRYEDGAGFGVGRFVRLLRATTLGCTRFSVDVASRDGGTFVDRGPGGASHLRYEGFRLDTEVDGQRVLQRYDEAFFFGF